MKSTTKNHLGALAAGIMLASVTSGQAAVTIDEFTSPASPGQTVEITNGIIGQSLMDPGTGLGSSVIGGSRELKVEIQNTWGTSVAGASVNAVSTPSFLALYNDVDVASSLVVTWDANGVGMNQNLSTESEFVMFKVFNDHTTSYTIAIETFSVGTSLWSISNTDITNNVDLTFKFNDFVGTANLTDIDRITLTVSSGRGADVRIDSMSAVPEPASAGLALLGLAGLMVRRRRA